MRKKPKHLINNSYQEDWLREFKEDLELNSFTTTKEEHGHS